MCYPASTAGQRRAVTALFMYGTSPGAPATPAAARALADADAGAEDEADEEEKDDDDERPALNDMLVTVWQAWRAIYPARPGGPSPGADGALNDLAFWAAVSRELEATTDGALPLAPLSLGDRLSFVSLGDLKTLDFLREVVMGVRPPADGAGMRVQYAEHDRKELRRHAALSAVFRFSGQLYVHRLGRHVALTCP